MSTPYRMREPCRWCGLADGTITVVSGQNVIRCAHCGRAGYNAPKTETGERPRTVATDHEALSPARRYEILERDGGRCILCGNSESILHVDHLLSIDDGRSLGLTAEELNDSENLATFCEACNVGKGRRSIPARLFVAFLRARVGARRANSNRSE